MKTAEISKQFNNYFISKGFVFLPGSSLLHSSIPMSFVMSAGLVQIETALNNNTELEGDTFSLVQKCFRYFDVACVGKDESHLSLFEMPGAFSFTAHGKKIAIQQMWQVITEVFGIDKTQLWITYFEGGVVTSHHLEVDKTTLNTWQKLGIPDNRLVGLGPEDNYWKQGGGIDGLERFRKCGPNTEIFYDRGEHLKCSNGCKPGCKCGRFMEFANSLFVGHEIDEETNNIRPLERPFTETVIGSERVAMIMQNTKSVFEIDSISPIIKFIRKKCLPNRLNINIARKSENVIADHLRALVHLVADGAPPAGKNGRPRLIKILIRETLTHALILNFDILRNIDELLGIILELSNIPNNRLQVTAKTKQYFINEADRFSNVQCQGKRNLKKYISQNKGHTLSGDQIVTLEKQVGFPNELSQFYLRELGLPFLRDDYLLALESWRNSLSAD